MSTAESRISLGFANTLANQMMAGLTPFCERIAVAGSVRRQKLDIGDIEIVCVPDLVTNTDLFGTPSMTRETGYIATHLVKDGFEILKNGEHFKQVRLPNGGINFDIFLTTPEQWGVIFTIRTGCADFSHRLVTPRSQGGLLMPSSLRVKDGRIWHGDTAYDTPEEINVFEIMGLKWIPPEERTR